MVLVRPDRDLAKANISRLNLTIKSNRLRNETKGELGSMSLVDLTPHGQLYRERFLTSGKQALNFSYYRYVGNLIYLVLRFLLTDLDRTSPRITMHNSNWKWPRYFTSILNDLSRKL